MAPAANSNGLFIPQPRPHAALRLFCFPFAGGGPTLFRNWPAELSERVEVCGVRLPGRESRWREPPFRRMHQLIPAVVAEIAPLLDRPFAFFGHSMGGLIAFEVARHLAATGWEGPRHLFISARPTVPPVRDPWHNLPEPEFRNVLRHLGGTAREILDNDEMMSLLSPMLRADFEVLETYTPQSGEPLRCPITVLGGADDKEVPPEKLDGWRERTRSAFRKVLFPGGHFYLTAAEAPLLRTLREELDPLIDRVAPEQAWPAAASLPLLNDDSVHVWSSALEQPKSRLDEYRRTLSADELERATRFVFERDRDAFIAGRGFLRTLLGHYVGSPPESLRFEYSDKGKPSLAGNAVRFNLAHSHGLALLAVTRRDEVGVDVEYIKPDVEFESLASSFFSPVEVDALFTLPASRRQAAFFNCWTRKEAYLKAIGKGLSLSLSDFDVTLDENYVRLLATRHEPAEANRWALHDLRPAGGYVGALAVAPGLADVRTARWG